MNFRQEISRILKSQAGMAGDVVIDAFAGDAFTMSTMTKSINTMPYKPRLLGSLGMFTEDGIPTLTVAIEEDSQVLQLVPRKPWGGVPTPVSIGPRKVRDFHISHLPLNAAVNAMEVQNIRGYANGMTPTQVLMTVEQLRDRKLKKMRDDLEVTLEYHRMGAVKGKILDADGVTVIYDLFTEFGVVQQTHNMVLSTGTTNVQAAITAATRKSLDAFGDSLVSRWVALCSDSFFDLLVQHANVEKFYLNWNAAQGYSQELRVYTSFPFGGVEWINYRGSVGGVSFVEADYAYLFPVGVPGMFLGYFGPSDYIDRVNQIPSPDGLPIEVRSEMKPMGKGIDLEAQSNPIYLNTRPRAVVKLHKHNG